MSLKREITFFYTDTIEYQTLEPVYVEAKARGFQVKFSKDIKEKAEIGIYCHHPPFYPENSKLSIITIHGIDQGSASWPNFWRKEKWGQFDIGLLPGRIWSNMWVDSSWYPPARTRLGVYELGWPKSDLIFSNYSEFEKRNDDLRNFLNLKYPFSVLYAPSFETDRKQSDVVDQLKNLPVNIIIKHWASESYKDDYPDIYDNVTKLRDEHSDIENVYFLDPDSSIMHALGLSDVLVTDESSVMYEALLLDIPSITISDWPMRTNNTDKARLINVKCDFVLKVEKKNLNKKISFMLKNNHSEVRKLESQRDAYYCELGMASKKIVNLIDSILDNKLPNEGLVRTNNKLRYDKYFLIMLYDYFKFSLPHRVILKILPFFSKGQSGK